MRGLESGAGILHDFLTYEYLEEELQPLRNWGRNLVMGPEFKLDFPFPLLEQHPPKHIVPSCVYVPSFFISSGTLHYAQFLFVVSSLCIL